MFKIKSLFFTNIKFFSLGFEAKRQSAFTLTAFSSRHLCYKRKHAFTLAEVLITLGIIGVVAAMTLPALIQKNNAKALEVAFKKSYSNLYSAFNQVIADGYPVYVSNPTESRPDGDPDWNSEFAQQVYSKYKKLKQISDKERSEYKNSAKNFTRKSPMGVPQCSQYMAGDGAFITPDGSSLSVFQNCRGLWFTIDTNGIKKGPNALGHDIFIFVAWKDTEKLVPANRESEVSCDEDGNCNYNNTAETANKCSKTSNSDINGATCASYAISDTCPWDGTKSYWECLP